MKNFLFRFKIQCIHIYNANKWYWHVKAHCPWVKYILRDDHLTKGFIFTSAHCSIQIICSNLQFHSDNKQAQTTWEGEQGDQVLRAGGRSHPPLPTGQPCLNFVKRDLSFVETSKLYHGVFLQEVDRSCRRAHTQSTLSMQSVGTTSGTSSSPVPPGGSQSMAMTMTMTMTITITLAFVWWLYYCKWLLQLINGNDNDIRTCCSKHE